MTCLFVSRKEELEMLDGYHILIVETDPQMADITGYRLRLLGYSVATAANNNDAMSRVGLRAPDVLIVSLDGDGLGAFELLERFASESETAGVPVLVMSTKADLDRVEKAWKHGAVDYLVVPFDPLVLEQKVSRLLAGKTPRSRLVTSGSMAAVALNPA